MILPFKNNYIMMFLVLFLHVYSPFLDCNKSKSLEIEISCIGIVHFFPNINANGNLVNYDTITDKVYYYHNQILYQSAYTSNSFSESGQLLKTGTEYRSFVYTNGNNYGYLTDPTKWEINKKMEVDSFFNQDWLFKPNADQLFSENITSFISSKKNKETEVIEKTYTITNKKDTTLTGSFVLYFSDKMKNFKYSFSKKLDSLNQMKLFKIKIINNKRYIKEYNLTIDRIVTECYIKECKVNNIKEVLSFFETSRENNLKND